MKLHVVRRQIHVGNPKIHVVWPKIYVGKKNEASCCATADSCWEPKESCCVAVDLCWETEGSCAMARRQIHVGNPKNHVL
jgi:hypothetical protein